MSELRPIGSEIEIFFAPMRNCTRPVFTVWKYRIKGHSKTSNGDAEELEPIDKREWPIRAMVPWMGKYTPVPPRECLPFLDAGWHALFENYAKASGFSDDR